MNYYQWNNLIGDLLFGPDKAGEPVLLHLTQSEIIDSAMTTGFFETERDAWRSFVRSPKWFGGASSLIECLTKALAASRRINHNDTPYETRYPLCLTLLVISVLPIVDTTDTDVNQSNYYDRAADYARLHGLPVITKNTESVNWNSSWQAVERWSLEEKGGAWGIFQQNLIFRHIYVGKPFSQCLIPPGVLAGLPRAFVRAGWVPQQPLTEPDWHGLLQQQGVEMGFRQAALQTIRTDKSLRAYVFAILQQRFNSWDGTMQTIATSVTFHKPDNPTGRRIDRARKEETVARFYLSFPDPDKTDGRFCWHYRVYSKAGLPDTLHLGGHAFNSQFGGWSGAVAIPFNEQLACVDPDNKWRVKWPDADIRLFEQGQWHGLSNRVWIEVNELSRVNPTWAICKPAKKASLRKWGQTFTIGQFSEWQPNEHFDGQNWPADYGLFRFERPSQGIPDTRFALPTTKQLEWVGGLKLGYNVFHNQHRPFMRVANGDGNDVVTAFTEAGQQIGLRQFDTNPTMYEFVDETPHSQLIICRLAGQAISLYGQFDNTHVVAQADEPSALPGRNVFGGIAELSNEPAYAGFAVSGLQVERLGFLKHIFYPAHDGRVPIPQIGVANWSLGDDLLAYLTCRKESQPTHFFDAYEKLLNEATVQEKITTPANVSKRRRWALGWYDTLGYVDYEYDSGRIRVLPPTLIPVPCQRGHRAILVGGRSAELLRRLRETAIPLGVTVSIESQQDESYLAPSVVSLFTEHPFNGKAYSPIQRIAHELAINFMADERPAWRLLERSGSLTDYRATLVPEAEAETTTWTLRVFNPDRLCFERPVSNHFDTSFTLVERQLNAYQFTHYLWIDGISYKVDKNWGRFLVLHQLGKQVAFRRLNHNQVAIPATLPLPRVLARGFSLLSGRIPVREEINLDGTRRPYLLYENAGNILSDNYVKKLGQQIQSTTL